MNRRDLLKALGVASALVGAALTGASVPIAVALEGAAKRSAWVPHDILARIRRRTRPLEARRLDADHDLAG